MTPRQQLAASFKRVVFDRMDWVPVAIPPEDGTITIVCGPGWSSVGIYRDGEWKGERGKALKGLPLHYMVFKDE